MLEKLYELIARAVVALESIAKNLEGARVAGAPATDGPAAPAAAAVVIPPPPPPIDDMGLGLDTTTAAATKVVHTKESILKLARETAEAKGRDHVKAALKKVKADTIADVKEESFEKFAEQLNAAAKA